MKCSRQPEKICALGESRSLTSAFPQPMFTSTRRGRTVGADAAK